MKRWPPADITVLVRTALLPLAVLFCFLARAQEPVYRHYDTRDGLAGAIVHGITQDKDGFIWFATETGLSRFDGRQFRNFTRADGLPSNEVLFTFSDSRNRLWIASFKNALCYYYKGHIYNQQNDPGLRNIVLPQRITGLYEIKDGTILAGMDKAGTFAIPPSGLPCFIPYLHTFPPAVRERYRLQRGTGMPPLLDLDPGLKQLVSDSLVYSASLPATPGQRPHLLFRLLHGIMLLPGGDTSRRFVMDYPDLLLCKPFDDSTLLLTSLKTGVRLYDFKRYRFTGQEYMRQYRVHDVLKDREGCIWFSTNGSGVFQLVSPGFTHYSFSEAAQSVAVQYIAAQGTTLQVITDEGNYWELEKQRLPAGDSMYRKTHKPAGPDQVRRQEEVMMSFNNANLSRILPGLPSTQLVKTLYYYHDTLLLASASHVLRIHLGQMRVLDTLYHSRATCAYKEGNSYYIGTPDGLYIYTAGRLIYAGDLHPLLRNRISTIARGKNGLLWIGTYEEGIVGLKDHKVVANLTEKSAGLSSNICRCLFVTGQYLWAGTEKGINKIALSGQRCKAVAHYNVRDGLQSDMINALYVAGPVVYAGTQAGLTIFNEPQVPQHGPCDISLTGITVSGKDRSNLPGAPLVLPPRDNNIRVAFAGISFLSGGDISYRYRLLGLQENWQTTREQFLSYPALPSGTYTLQVQAINKFGDESRLLEQTFTVQPRFLERGEVQLVLLFLFLGAIALVVRWRVRKMHQKEREQAQLRKKLMDLEQQALRAQMNPHFIFNCLNSMQHFIWGNDPRKANSYMTLFAGLVRSTLNNAPRMYISLREELDYLDAYMQLEQMQLSPGFRYRIEVAPDINPITFRVPNMVIQPFAENAIKHGVAALGEEGFIEISFYLSEAKDYLLCAVTDNGPGILRREKNPAPSGLHQPQGIRITKERILLLNELSDTNRPVFMITEWAYTGGDHPYGTRIILSFPC